MVGEAGTGLGASVRSSLLFTLFLEVAYVHVTTRIPKSKVLYSLWGFLGQNSGDQAWGQVTLPAEPSWWPFRYILQWNPEI